MTNFWTAIVKYLRWYPDAKLVFIYEITYDDNKIITVDKRFARRYKFIRGAKIERKLICRTLF